MSVGEAGLPYSGTVGESTGTVFVDGTGASYSVTERSPDGVEGYSAGPVEYANGLEEYSSGPYGYSVGP